MLRLKRYTKMLICSAGLLSAALLSACGSGDQGRDPILGIPAATLVGVAVTPATATINIGATQQLTATATYTDGSAVNVTTTASWTSATATVATVAATGAVTGVRAGAAAITASFAGQSGSSTITVRPATAVSLALTPANTTLQIGATRQLAAVATYSDGTAVDVTATSLYTSANPQFVSINAGGIIKGVATGASVLTATFSGLNATAQANTTTVGLTGIAVLPATATVGIGGTQQFIAVGTYSDQSTAVITSSVAWTSSNNAVATVLGTGIATGITVGNSTITATLNGQSGSGVLTVVAIAPVATVTPVNLRSATTFAVLAGTSLTNNSGGTTLITGDVGSPSQTTAPTVAPGFTDYQSGAILDNALADLQFAITDANSRTCDVTFAANIDLGGLALPPGVYCYAGTISVTGTLILNGSGVYIFRTAQTLNTTANSVVALTNGATAANVSWVPTGPSTLGANSVFIGSILGKSAAITVGDNTTLLNGRVLSAAAVTLRNNQIAK